MHYEYKLVELVNTDAAVESYINDVAFHGWRVHTYVNRTETEIYANGIHKILFERAV